MSRVSLAGKRVLLITTYWAPEHTGSAPYVTQIGHALAAVGADVEVLTTWPHYPSWVADRSLPADTREDGVRVRRFSLRVPSRPGLGGRAGYEGGFLARVSLSGLCSERPDLVLACMPTLGAGMAARMLARRWKVPLALVVHDLMGAAATQSGYAGADRIGGLLEAAERACYRSADLLLPCSPAFVPALRAAGARAEDIDVVLPWAKDVPTELSADLIVKTRVERGWAERTVVLHSGNIGHKQGLDELLPTLEHLGRTAPEVLTVLMGDGNQAGDLRSRLSLMPHVQMLPPVSGEDYLPTVAAADVCLIHERSTVSTMSLPSKLSSYFTAARPVLAVTAATGATAAVLGESGAGVVIAHGDAAGFVRAVRSLAGTPEGERRGAAGAAYLRSEMDRETCLRTVVARVAGCLAEGRL